MGLVGIKEHYLPGSPILFIITMKTFTKKSNNNEVHKCMNPTHTHTQTQTQTQTQTHSLTHTHPLTHTLIFAHAHIFQCLHLGRAWAIPPELLRQGQTTSRHLRDSNGKLPGG